MPRPPRSFLPLALLLLALPAAPAAGGDAGAPPPAAPPADAAPAAPAAEPAPDVEDGLEIADGLVLLEPRPGDAVAPPLRVEGRARGTWFFEAEFPLRLLGPDGSEIAVAPALAEGMWMTTGFVPFSGELTVSEPLPPGPWTLVLREADPSDGEAGEPREARIELRPAP